MSTLERSRTQVLLLKVLGGLAIHRDGRPVSGALAQPRRLAVLALLARGGPDGVPRDRLIATLWPDIDEERARRTFNQTLYAIRRELGADDTIVGMRELRLNTELLSVDLLEFQAALAERNLQRAIELYRGRFLDGFHMPGADEFERWVDRERASLDATYTNTLEQLARDATARADHTRAVEWWRKRAAHDPLDARVAIALMQSLDASGDRRAAIQHARVYELLIEEELSLPPDREVVRFAEQLRERAAAAESQPPTAPVALATPLQAAEPVTETTEPVTAPRRPVAFPAAEFKLEPVRWESTRDFHVPVRPSRPFGRRTLMAIGVAAAVTALGTVVLLQGRGAAAGPAPAIAVGRITDYRRGESAAIAGSLTDLLATNLGRASDVRVVSTARMYDLLRRIGDGSDSTAAAFATVARQAGAEELLDGAVYDHSGRLRLDLRRVDLASGAVRAAYSVEASDVFSLADSGTAHVIAGLGGSAPPGSVADVTTRSATALRMYEQGLRAHARGDAQGARKFFDAAIAEDSMFAMAQYYAAVDAGDVVESRRRLERARQLAGRATDRERLTIMAGWASAMSVPSLRAIAETLAVRYPSEVFGHLNVGIALALDGQYLEALKPLERVVAMDSLGLRNAVASCAGCDALRWIVSAYELADSLPAAERVARRWLRLQPDSRAALGAVTEVLDFMGRGAEADSALRANAPRVIERADALGRRATYLIRAGDFDAADRLLADVLAAGGLHEQIDAYWALAISLRQQGRLAEALQTARRMRTILPASPLLVPGSAPTIAVLEAQILLEIGRPRAAAALFDSIARGRDELESGATAARRATWNLAHSAGARAVAGDTVALVRLVDSVQSLGAESGIGRDKRLHHYVRGLTFVARRNDEAAVTEFRQAILSRNFGYTRTNYELARALMRLGRPVEAIEVLQPALRGSVESSNLYVTRTELHELLAQAWDGAGGRDSAVAHYRAVAAAWKGADAPFQQRRAAIEARLAALGGRK